MSPSEPETLTSSERASKFLSATCIAICAAAICFQAWRERSSMNEDGMSYLDMALAAANGQTASLVNLYWSPLYPSLIAAVFKTFSSAPSQEFLLVHSLNAAIGLLALGTFTFFFKAWTPKAAGRNSALQGIWFVFAYGLFLWSTIQTTGVGTVSPDLLVNAFVFLAAGLVCRIRAARRSRKPWAEAAVLGITLALASWTKAAQLPLGVALLFLLIFWRGDLFSWKLWLVSAIVFLVSVAPLLIWMSHKAHRLTFGESGRINYAWEVQQEIPLNFGWTEGTPGTGTPVHPPRVLSQRPKTYEYAGMTDGTFPPWYEPAYFHEGLRIRFLPGKQWRAFWQYANDLRWGHGRSFLPLLIGLILLGWGLHWKIASESLRTRAWALLWPAMAFCAYSLVFMQARYVAPFLVLFWLALYDIVLAGQKGAWKNTVLAAVAAGVIAFSVSAAASSSKGAVPLPDFTVVSRLKNLGLQNGDSIAVIGPGYNAYFAHLGRMRIMGHIEDPDQFWALGRNEAQTLLSQLQAAGAKAVISMKGCPTSTPPPWIYLDTPGYCAYLFH